MTITNTINTAINNTYRVLDHDTKCYVAIDGKDIFTYNEADTMVYHLFLQGTNASIVPVHS